MTQADVKKQALRSLIDWVVATVRQGQTEREQAEALGVLSDNTEYLKNIYSACELYYDDIIDKDDLDRAETHAAGMLWEAVDGRQIDMADIERQEAEAQADRESILVALEQDAQKEQ